MEKYLEKSEDNLYIKDRKKLFQDFVSNFQAGDLKLLRECLDEELAKKMVAEYVSMEYCKLKQKVKKKKRGN